MAILFAKTFGSGVCAAAEFGLAAAAVFRQIFDKLADAFHIKGVVNEPPMPRLRHEPRAIQLFQMEGDAGRADPDGFCDLSSRNAARSGANEVPEDGEPVLLGKSGKGTDSDDNFHNPTIQRLSNYAIN